MASKLMSWYGSVINAQQDINFEEIPSRWQQYRLQYIDDVEAIKIIKTDLKPLDNTNKQYQFDVTVLMQNEMVEQLIHEQFEFNLSAQSLPEISSIKFNSEPEQVRSKQSESTETRDALYYKAREFSYAWLAYLDGAEKAVTLKGLDSAIYDITIGSKHLRSSVVETLEKRQPFLTQGGHTLRSVDLSVLNKEDKTYLLEISMNWKGVNSKNKAVIAKINQKITLQMTDANYWQIIEIKEQHLLPDLTPWQDILC
ncbi:hypothetical protein CDW43_15170 [Methylophaga nitratireducenticrescens]|nr:hypothetical protein CDW43_15170 [Methylophaga nitratireducenticrescens]